MRTDYLPVTDPMGKRVRPRILEFGHQLVTSQRSRRAFRKRPTLFAYRRSVTHTSKQSPVRCCPQTVYEVGSVLTIG